jgi:UDP-N-acetylglucosamine 2-epimerase (non-hydrolysing)
MTAAVLDLQNSSNPPKSSVGAPIRVPKVTVFVGTRPEVIKTARVVQLLKDDPAIEVELCIVRQQTDILDAALAEWRLRADTTLHLEASDRYVANTLASVVRIVSTFLRQSQPDFVLVQGDTTTAFGASLAAFYAGIPVGHIEAGLRSGDRASPFPEEVHRTLTDRLASVLYAPTERARENLLREGHPAESVRVVGNTVVDALFEMRGRARAERPADDVMSRRRMLLVTGHRRESFGHGVRSVCAALRTLVRSRDDIEVVYVLHPNPAAHEPVRKILEREPHIQLIVPQGYRRFVDLLDRSYIVITDSGGIQEEAPYFGKPVLVTRESTERPEAMELGLARLVGTHCKTIVSAVNDLLDDPVAYRLMAEQTKPYGDGTSSLQIHADLHYRLGIKVGT